jgi:dephospho-CoA kinase
MIVVGLTGSIAMGKSETARMFRAENVPVFDADEYVTQLYRQGGAAVEPVGRQFPEAIIDGAVDRAILSRILAADPQLFARLEAIVHPLVKSGEEKFLADCRARNEPLVVLDIPLLFETGRESDVDIVVVVTAPADIQRQRALARTGMTEEKLGAILARQMPDSEKRRRADMIIDTSQGLEAARRDVKAIIRKLRSAEDNTRA